MAKDFMLLEALQTVSVKDAIPWLGRLVRYYQKPMAGYTPSEGTTILPEKNPYEDMLQPHQKCCGLTANQKNTD